MTIDDPALAERPFTETHDRILHALVEQVHEMGQRLLALESELASGTHKGDLAPPAVPATPHDSVETRPAPARVPSRPADRPAAQTRSSRPAGWQPARR